MKKIFFITTCTALLMAGFSSCTKDDNIDDNNKPLYVIDFENVDAAALAGPTSYGANLYDGHANQYTGYTDAGSGLRMMINELSGSYNFSNGGVAISRWNDTTTADYTNQCSVYYNDAATGKGGYGGSNTFAVATGYNDPGGWATRSRISFEPAGTERVFDHFYVTNTTYAALTMREGNAFTRQFGSGDWFKLVIEGFNKSGASTGKVEFYLADFQTSGAPGIITEWTKVDLWPLGSVAAITFDLQSSDTGEWGMNTPAYFCFDNLTVDMP
jgi:hypothetical protein